LQPAGTFARGEEMRVEHSARDSKPSRQSVTSVSLRAGIPIPQHSAVAQNRQVSSSGDTEVSDPSNAVFPACTTLSALSDILQSG
jgi:hypothetical protein